MTATDGVNSETIRVRVELTDLNDNRPVFDMPVYRFQIIENRLPKSLGFVRAFDADKPDTGFSRVRYQLLEDADSFRLDEVTGELILLRELDYEIGMSV